MKGQNISNYETSLTGGLDMIQFNYATFDVCFPISSRKTHAIENCVLWFGLLATFKKKSKLFNSTLLRAPGTFTEVCPRAARYKFLFKVSIQKTRKCNSQTNVAISIPSAVCNHRKESEGTQKCHSASFANIPKPQLALNFHYPCIYKRNFSSKNPTSDSPPRKFPCKAKCSYLSRLI